MEIPYNAIELVKKWEGLHKQGADGLVYPYLCPAGTWTIGYGSTRDWDHTRITGSTPPKTEGECELLMRRELEGCVLSAMQHSPRLADNPEALGAIASFIFNLGASSYYRSTLRRRINDGMWEEAQSEIKRWVWGGGKILPGLIARRNDEAQYLNEKQTKDPCWLL